MITENVSKELIHQFVWWHQLAQVLTEGRNRVWRWVDWQVDLLAWEWGLLGLGNSVHLALRVRSERIALVRTRRLNTVSLRQEVTARVACVHLLLLGLSVSVLWGINLLWRRHTLILLHWRRLNGWLLLLCHDSYCRGVWFWFVSNHWVVSFQVDSGVICLPFHHVRYSLHTFFSLSTLIRQASFSPGKSRMCLSHWWRWQRRLVVLLYCIWLEILGHILLNCRGVLLHKVSKPEMIQNGLMKLSVKHFDEFRVSSQLFQLRCLLQSVLVPNEIHQMHLGKFAKSVAIEYINIFLQVPVDGR